MKRTARMILMAVLLMGGGVHYTNLGALDPQTNKMENAKEELLGGEVAVLIEDCPVTIKPLKRSDEETETIVLAIEMKNPSSQEKKIVFWVEWSSATLLFEPNLSASLSRVPMPASLPVLNDLPLLPDEKIEATLPSGQSGQKEIILSALPVGAADPLMNYTLTVKGGADKKTLATSQFTPAVIKIEKFDNLLGASN